MRNRFSTEKVESIMRSLEGMQPAAAPDFFYTRLQGKMQPAEPQRRSFILRPAFVTTALSFLLIVNVFSLFTMDRTPKQDPAARYQQEKATPASIESFTRAYDMHSGSVYE